MQKEQFLDMTIQDSGNSDGVTLVVNGCSYGNFGKDWDMARKYALIWYMLLRPHEFGHAIINKMQRKGSGTWGEYFKLERQIKKEGLQIPDGVEPSKCNNFLITFKGEII